MSGPRHERELRDLLARVVPGAPAIDGAPVAAAGRRSRARRRAGAAVLAAAVAAVVAAVVAVGGPSVDRTSVAVGGPSVDRTSVAVGGPSVDRTSVADTPLADPYTADPCSAVVGGISTDEVLPSFRDVTAVRICASRGMPDREIAPSDAVVTDLDQLTNEIAALPGASTPMESASCTLERRPVAPVFLELTRTDGSALSVDLSRSPCRVGGPSTDAVVRAVVGALGRQRTALGHTALGHTALAGAAPSCDQEPTIAPVDPTRDPLVAAVGCLTARSDGSALGDADLAGLNRAWAHPGPVSDDICSGVIGRTVAVTDLGDVVVIMPGCAGPTWNPRHGLTPDTAEVQLGG